MISEGMNTVGTEGWGRASRVCGEPRHAKICGACETAAGGIMRLKDDSCVQYQLHTNSTLAEKRSHVTAEGCITEGEEGEVSDKNTGHSVEAILICAA